MNILILFLEQVNLNKHAFELERVFENKLVFGSFIFLVTCFQKHVFKYKKLFSFLTDSNPAIAEFQTSFRVFWYKTYPFPSVTNCQESVNLLDFCHTCIGWVCCWFSPCSEGFSLGSPVRFPPSLKSTLQIQARFGLSRLYKLGTIPHINKILCHFSWVAPLSN